MILELERHEELLQPPLGAPQRSKGLLEPPLGAPSVLEGAAQACSVPHVATERHFQPPLGAAGGPRANSWVTGRSIIKVFENAARRICARLHLGTVTLHSQTA